MAKSTMTLLATAIDHPLVHFGREVYGDLATALRRQWCIPNGYRHLQSFMLKGTLPITSPFTVSAIMKEGYLLDTFEVEAIS